MAVHAEMTKLRHSLGDMAGLRPPVVLSLSGHDPTGGAGIQADIEVLFRLRCHPCTVITALTAQDTCDVRRIYPQDPSQFLHQALTLIEDLTPAAIKIGLVGSTALAVAVADVVKRVPGVPVVFDPVLAAGGGTEWSTPDFEQALRDHVIPIATILTPNTHEARRLTGRDTLDACAAEFLALGCQSVLITGTHDESEQVINRLYRRSEVRDSSWPRLPGTYHGSGCTLAAATAGFLALGQPLEQAVDAAQSFTWEALRAAHALGRGQWLPNRRMPEAIPASGGRDAVQALPEL